MSKMNPDLGFITLNLDLSRLHGNAGMPT